jgi:hypothetical protein
MQLRKALYTLFKRVSTSLDGLMEDTLVSFFIRALSRFSIPNEISITTDGYHYESVLKRVSAMINVRIRRQLPLPH